MDLRRGERVTTRGLPRPADAAVAEEILKVLDEMSAPFGTAVEPDGTVTVRASEREPSRKGD